MDDFPQQIENLRRDIAKTNFTIRSERERLNVIEAETHIDIATAKDVDGKLIFTNDVMRRAGFVKAISQNQTHVVISQSVERLERDKDFQNALLEKLRLQFKLHLLELEAEIAATK